MKFIKTIIFLVVAILVGVFASNNKELVEVDLFPLPIKFAAASFILFFGGILIGVIVGGGYQTFRAMYWRRVANTTKRKLETAEGELKEKNDNQNQNLWIKN